MLTITRLEIDRKDRWNDSKQPYYGKLTIIDKEEEATYEISLNDAQCTELLERNMKWMKDTLAGVGGTMQKSKVVVHQPPAIEHKIEQPERVDDGFPF